ncbi:uncharacterized protein LOC130672638 [Microplitis mediator]|uniref:uncharacterized protein LOC130672638 n=1 Tax=Microplitis mediator TaxID=375433 RepID=UPI002552F566|nr:uncharacterized protein LOC130672638 [Microplitis mediator]
MQSDTPRLPTYAEATAPADRQYEHHPTVYSTYPTPIPSYTTTELPNYVHSPSVNLYQYTNNQLPTNTPVAQRIHVITEAHSQPRRSFSCTKRQGTIWGIIFGLLLFAGICRLIMSFYHNRY